ncbi:AIG2-like family domain-containing protein [Phthorimaea operculella]|nr:AIG2-like family domain-containing protein [Phthorimaea operculella]
MLFHIVCMLFVLRCVIGLQNDDDAEIYRISNKELPVQDAAVVYYFAYATNMLQKRLREKCPKSMFIGAALLKNHRLDFTMEVPWWNGAVATVSNEVGAGVWGVLWAVRILDMDDLDEQEGVSAGWYHQKEVIVYFEGQLELKAITYVQNNSPRKLDILDHYPAERLPSKTYLEVMIIGAIVGGLPDVYIQYLKSIPTNGRVASHELIKRLLLPAKNRKLLL